MTTGIKRPGMKVTSSTRVCSAHFAPGCTIPYVKSPSLIRPEKTARRTIVRQTLHESSSRTAVPSLKELCRFQLQDQLGKLHHLEQEHISTKRELCNQIDKFDQLQNRQRETMQAATSLENAVSLLQSDKSHLHSQMVSKVKAIESLEAEMSRLTLETVLLKSTVDRLKQGRFHLHAEDFDGRDKDINFYTGFCSWDLFMLFFRSLSVYDLDNLQYFGRDRKFPSGDKRGPPRALNPLNEYFLMLVRLRLGLLEEDLADRFGISQALVSVIFNTWLCLVHSHLLSLGFWPSRETINEHMPREFMNSKYSKTRVIIDATELFIQKPSDLALQSVTWSNYKSHNTLKGLIGISPFGSVTFVSELWAGSISDVELIEKSGLLDLLEAGDSVMADKGFTISDLLAQRGVSLNIPPFMQNGKMSEGDVKLTRSIATLRIHVERAIERIKNFRIISGCIPNSIPAGTVSKIFTVCSLLTNMQSPLVKPRSLSSQPASAPTKTALSSTITPVHLSSHVDQSSTAANGRSLSEITNLECQTPQVLSVAEIKRRLTVTSETQAAVEDKTKEQNNSHIWFQVRKYRITSSNFGVVIKRRADFDVLASRLINKQHFSIHHNMPIPLRWGIEHEDIARDIYSARVQKLGCTLVKSGVWIDIERGWLAASPDGLVFNSSGKLVGIIEIKCPFSAKDMTPLEAAKSLPSFPCKEIDGHLALKREHNYFYQVQGQLAITHAPWCDFCIYTPHGFSIERIDFELPLWQQMVQNLETFFDKFMIPCLSHMNVPDTETLM